MVLCVFHIEVIVWSCQSQEDGFKLKCSSTTLHFIFLLQTDFTVGEIDETLNIDGNRPVHIFSKCIFRLNDAAHSPGGCSVQGKDIVSKGLSLIFNKCHFYWSGLSGMVLESVIYSGQLKNIKNSDQTQ